MNWELKRLDELCEIQPKKAKLKTFLKDDSSVSFMGMDMLGIDKIHAIPEEIKELSTVYKPYTYFQENDVLLAKITPCFENGKLGIAKQLVNGVGFGSSEFTVYRCGSELLPEYLYYFLKSDLFRLEGITSMSGAVGHKRVTKNYLVGALVPLPPLPVQKQIVEKLDAAFADIDKTISATEKNIENAEALYSAKSDSFFSENEEQTKLSEVASITSILIDPKEEPYKEMQHVGAGNIESETGNLNNVITASEEKLTSGKFPFDTSMVLYSKIRPYLKKVVKPDFSGICSADIYPLSVNEELMTRDFLFHLFLSRNFTDYAIAGSNRAGMPKVNRTHLFNYEFNLPDIPKQKEITENLDKFAYCCRNLIQINKYKVDNLNSLKSSILNQAFSGELRKDAA